VELAKIIQKKRGKTFQKSPKGRNRGTHVMLSFPPLFSTELKAIKGGHFSKVRNGSPSIIIVEGIWFFSLPSSHSRHLQKNVCDNTSCEKVR
jgi:hypothetical protein